MTTISDILSNRRAKLNFLMIAKAYNLDTDIEETLYFSQRGFKTEPTDIPADQYFKARLSNPAIFVRILAPDLRIGGRSVPDYGFCELNNADGGLDYLERYSFVNRDCTIWVGNDDLSFNQYQIIFDGLFGDQLFERSKIRLGLKSRSLDFDQPLQAKLYTGTNNGATGDEGTSGDIKDFPKIIVYGQRKNIRLVAVNTSGLRFQAHDGQIESFDLVHDKRTVLLNPADYTDNIVTGILTLNSLPADHGQVTADIKGSKTGGSYLSTIADIVRRIAEDQVGLTWPDDFDTQSFTDLNTKNSAVVGDVFRNEISAGQAIDRFVQSAGGFWFETRDRKLKIIRLEAPTTIADHEFKPNEISSIRKLPAGDSSKGIADWKIILGYEKIDIMSAADVAGSVAQNPDILAYLEQEYRKTSSEDVVIKTKHKNAGQLEKNTLFVNKADADTESVRLLALFGVKRNLLRVTLPDKALLINLNDVVKITWNRYGLDGGKYFRVIRVEDNIARRKVTIDIWG